MCGIAGIVDQAPIPDLERPLRRMQAALRHRGPDDAGIFVSPGRQAGFAHTRLAIIDLSSAGHQPMSTPDGRITVVFNGEIYNFRELRKELEARGTQFRTNSDTEVILRLYEHLGEGFVDRLRGMFAIALWDERERLCLLARDPLGIKPLYMRLDKGGGGHKLAFASEVRALVAGGVASAKVSPEGLLGFLRSGSVPEPLTILDGVECLPAGSMLIWRSGEVRRRVYWQYPPGRHSSLASNGADQPQAVSRLRLALLDSVKAHYVSDVPVGIFLSGGIDSTAVLALSRAIGQTDIRTFSISFAEAEFQEGVTARRTAGAFQTEHHEWQLVDSDAAALLGDFWNSLDQPTVDGFNTWCVSRAASERGMKVVLSGLGGDELFAGYPSFTQAPMLAGAGRIPGILRKPLGKALQRHSRRPQWRRVGEFLQGEARLPDAWSAVHALFTWSEASDLAGWLLGERPDELPIFAESQLGEMSHLSSREIVSVLETSKYMRNQLLRDSDVMSMAWGLELRVPLVDSRLAEHAATLPARLRLRSGKQLLVESVPEIPEWVLNRPKMGFQFPFEKWMEGDWGEQFAAVTVNSPVPLRTWYQRWAVLAFRVWWDRLRDHSLAPREAA